MTTIIRSLLCLLTGLGLAAQALAEDDDESCHPVGTWVITVQFPALELQFRQLLTIHKGGTLSETNTALHANAFPDPDAPVLPFPPPVNGSDGHGAWKRLPGPGCRIRWSMAKFMFNGSNLLGPVGAHVGYLRTAGVLVFSGDSALGPFGETRTEIVFGPDPTGRPVETLPPSVSSGFRWLPID